jgi:signal transduction histidine kinase
MNIAGLHRLQEIVARATEATTFEGVARVLVEEGGAVLGTSIGGVWLLQGEQLELVHYRGPQPSENVQVLPLNADAPLPACVREGAPIWLIDREDYARRFPASYTRLGVTVGCACLPLVVEGHPIGGAVFAFDHAPALGDLARDALALIVRQCAHALDRIRHVEQAEQLARRMKALQAVAMQFAAARSFDEIARITLTGATDVIGGSSAALWRLEGQDAVLAVQFGAPPEVVDAVRRLPLDDPGGLTTSLRTRTPLWLASRADAARRLPVIEVRWRGIEAIAFVPLVANGRMYGALGVGFERPHSFDSRDREFIELYATHAAQALARDRDDTAQRALASATAAMASSLEPEAVLQRIGELTVATFADWCFVDLARGEGWLERVVVAHADRNDADVAARMRRFLPPVHEGVARAVAMQEPQLFEVVTEPLLMRVARDPAHLDALRALRVNTLLSVPMSVAGRAIGGITWASRGQPFDHRDLQLATQLARAAAAAVENARLFAAEAAAARRVGKLYELSVALSSPRKLDDVGRATTRLSADATGALSCTIWVRDPGGALRTLASTARETSAAEAALLPDPERLPHRVLATGEPFWVEAPHDYERSAGEASPRPGQARQVQPLAAFPLSIGGGRAGVIAFTFEGDHRFDVDERTFLAAIARSCEQALERAQLNATEAAARAAAESASRAKDEFLAMLGHELRNPLAPIVTALDLMRMRGVSDGVRERGVIERQVQHLTRLVDDLLDISRITRGKIELRRKVGELRAAIEPALEAVGPLLMQAGHQLAIDVPSNGLRVDADPARLSQIVRNLLANAAKFTPPRGHLAIVAREHGGSIELAICDDGPGISAELLPRVFEPFVQGSQGAERAGGGLGLGLAIVQSLVELHGGTVAIAGGDDGRGTRVTVRLPRAEALVPGPTDRASDDPGRPLRVLVVDDNIDAATLLGDLLRCLGHEPMIAHDGPSALAVVARERPQLAILDIGLPGMDGYELVRRLREDPTLARVPVLALTGYGQASDRDRTRAAGFADHLVKPIDLQRLHDIVGRYASAR